MSRPIVKEIAGTAVGVRADVLAPDLAARDADRDGYVEPHELRAPTAPLQGTAASTPPRWQDVLEQGREAEHRSIAPGTAARIHSLVGGAEQVSNKLLRPGTDGLTLTVARYAQHGNVQAIKAWATRHNVAAKAGVYTIVTDTAMALTLKTSGALARGEVLTQRETLTSIATTGAYEGLASWGSAKVGAVVGVKVGLAVAAVTGPAAPIAGPVAGIIAGVVTTIAIKNGLDLVKDRAVLAGARALD